MAGYIFPRNEKTHKELLDSINKRKKDEEERQNRGVSQPRPARPINYGIAGAARAREASLQDAPELPETPHWAGRSRSATPVSSAADRQTTIPGSRNWWKQKREREFEEARDAWMEKNYAALDPMFNPTPVDSPRYFGIEPPEDPLAQPYATDPMFGEVTQGGERGVAMQARMARGAATQRIIEQTKNGDRVELKLDPLGKELMVTTPPANEKTSPTIHLYPEQMKALDTVDGYREKLMQAYPDHQATERPIVPEATFGETMKFMGNVAMETFDVVEAFVFEPFAETVAEIVTGDFDTWDPRRGFGLTILDEGLIATTEKFRDRPAWQQLVYSMAFDPSYVFAGLGLLKIARSGTRLTKDLVATSLKKFDPNISAADADRGADQIIESYRTAGAGSAQPEGGWMPRGADGHDYTPQEILRRGGLDIDLESPLPNRTSVSDADYDLAWDDGMRKIREEGVAREGLDVTVDQQKLLRVLENIEFDPEMRMRVVRQLTNSLVPEVQDVVWRRFIRFTLSAMQKAGEADGAIPGAGRQAPFDRKAMQLLRRERDAAIITKPEGAQLVAPPREAIPPGLAPTVSAGTGAPLRPDVTPIKADTPEEFLDVVSPDLFGVPDEPKGILKGLPIKEKVSREYERQQSWWLDRHAAGNAAAGRAKRSMIAQINDFIDSDIQQVNNEIIDNFRKQGIPASDARVKNALIRSGMDGFQKLKRMPGEFDFELQAALASGAPGASVNHARQPLRRVRDIVKKAKSDAGKKLNVDQINSYLVLMHGIDVINVKQAAARARAEAEGKVATPTGQLHLFPLGDRTPITNPASPTTAGSIYGPRATHKGKTMQDMQSMLWRQQQVLESQTITRVENGRTIVTNQWEEVKAASKVVTDHYRDLLDMQLAEGMVTKELSDLLRRQYKHYNPIKYVEGTLLNIHSIHNDGNKALLKGVAQNDIRVLAEQGIDADLVRPLEQLTDYTMRVYLSAFRNRAIKALIPTLMYDPRNASRVRHVIDDAGDLTTVAQLRPGPVAKDMMRVARMINGKAEVWDIPKEFEPLVDGLASFDQAMSERILRNINKIPRSLLTAHNPVFFTYNFMHDMLASFLVEGVMPHSVAMSLMRNLKYVFAGNDKFVDEWARAGGWVGGFAGQSSEDLARVSMRGGDTSLLRAKKYDQVIDELHKAPQKPGSAFREEFDNYKKFRKLVQSPVWMIGQIAEAVEQAPRRAVAQKVRGQGGTWQEAAFRSRRVTVDFQRRGRAVNLIDAAFLYTNAAMQGAMLPVRAMTQGGWAPRLRISGLAGVAAGLYFWNTQDKYEEAFSEMSATDKYTKFNVMLGHKWDRFGHRVPVSLAIAPLLREFAAFSAPMTIAMEMLRGRSEKADWEQFVKTMIPSLNPLNQITNFGGRDASFGWQGIPTPTAIGNLINETFTNWDSFRGQPIVPDDMSQREKHLQYDAFTTRTARRFAGLFDLSPKIVDHWMRVGALRDVIYGVDRIARFFDPDEPDPQIEAMTNEFEQYLDIQPELSEENLLANPELSGSLEEREAEWKSKNHQRVLNDFFKNPDYDYVSITAEEKNAMDDLMTKRWRENRTYTPDGAPIAFVTSATDKYIRSQGGNLSRLGQMKATRELRKKGYDINVRESRIAAGRMDQVMQVLNNTQLEQDGALWAGQRSTAVGQVPTKPGLPELGPDGQPVEPDPPTRYIDGQEWIKNHQMAGKIYAANMFAQAGILPQAAQLQGFTGSPDAKPGSEKDYISMADFIRDTGAWADYKRLVATGAGGWDDTRSQASYMASAYRGIQMTYDVNGKPDFTRFFDEREEFEAMVKGIDLNDPTGPRLDTYSEEFGDTPEKRDATWDRMAAELTASMTITELEYYRDMQLIRPYWDIGRNILDTLSQGPLHDTWQTYLEVSPQVRTRMEDDPVEGFFIGIVQKMVDGERYRHRLTHPNMDGVYIKWGYATEPILPAGPGADAKRWLEDNIDANRGIIDAQAQERIAGRAQPPSTGSPLLDMKLGR